MEAGYAVRSVEPWDESLEQRQQTSLKQRGRQMIHTLTLGQDALLLPSFQTDTSVQRDFQSD